MQAGSGKIFYPASSGETLQRIGPTGVMKFREQVIIRLPMYSLREISLMEISQHLKNEDDIESLELPSGLLKELKETLCTKIIFDHMYEWLVANLQIIFILILAAILRVLQIDIFRISFECYDSDMIFTEFTSIIGILK